MFHFFDRKKTCQKKVGDQDDKLMVAPGTEITYKEMLISQYHDEHENLRRLFDLALTAYQQTKDDTFRLHLYDLHIALRKHLLDEELNLYVYLRHCYLHDKNKQALIARFKKNSKKTGVKILSCVRKLSDEKEQIIRDNVFVSQLINIGNMQAALFAAEEQHLYPVYKTPELAL